MKRVKRGAGEKVYMSEAEESKSDTQNRALYQFDEKTFFAKSTAIFTQNDTETILCQLKSAF